MNRFLALLLLATMVVGCRTRSTPISNPFLAPDRVPPPATRMPAPGTAIPYYDNGQSVAPPVIQQGAGAPPTGSGTYSPGASTFPGNGPNSTLASGRTPALTLSQDVLPPSSQRVRTAIAEVPVERGVAIPADNRAARLAVRPIEPPVLQRPPAPTLRPSIRSVAAGPNRSRIQDRSRTHTPPVSNLTSSGNDSNRWLTPGQYGVPTPRRPQSSGVAVLPPAAVLPASAAIPLSPTANSSAGTYAYPVGAVVASPMAVAGGCCPPYGQGFYPNGWQTVEISELPPAGVQGRQPTRTAAPRSRLTGTSGGQSRSGRWNRPSLARRSEPSGVRLASADRSIGSDQLLTTAADATPRTWARYGIGPKYGWLQGRLERSPATGQWKLRYIPIDGATDEYGGSVVIDNPGALDGFDPGDFVKVNGSLDAGRSDDISFAAIYRVARVQPLAE